MRSTFATFIGIAALLVASPVFASSALLPLASYGTTTPFTVHYTVGDRIRVEVGPLRARAAPGIASNILTVEKVGAQGMVYMGASLRDGLVWWLINYDDGTQGWSAEDFLAEANVSDTNAALVQQLQAELQSLLAQIQSVKAQQ